MRHCANASDREIKKALCDRIYDKRKLAALDLEQLVRDCLAAGDRERIQAIITELVRDFAYAVHHPNYRNGGLIGLAAVSIALGTSELAVYLDDIIQPILSCFGDADARVRYFACESLYNVAKVAKGEILQYFNEVFDVLCRLVADSEESVRNGADLVDRLIKDIVAEKAATYKFSVNRSSAVPPAVSPSLDGLSPAIQAAPNQFSDSFSLANFIPVLIERIYVINPSTRMFLVQWIVLLDSIPDLELIIYLPEFLRGLLTFLNDPNKDVRVSTKNLLETLLRDIRSIAKLHMSLKPAEPAVTPLATPEKPQSTSSSLYQVGQDTVLDYDRIVNILLDNLHGGNSEIQATILEWLQAFYEVAPNELAKNFGRLVSVLLPTLCESSTTICDAAQHLNDELLEAVKTNSMTIEYSSAVNALTLQFLHESEVTRVAAVNWLVTLQKVGKIELSDSVLSTLLRLLSDTSDVVVTKDLELLAQILHNSTEDTFRGFIRKLLVYLDSHRQLEAARGKLITSRLCQVLAPERLYRYMAEILEEYDDVEFVCGIVQNINNNLMISPELSGLREMLRRLDTPEGASLFVTLFKTWSRNSVAAISLCLLAQAYEYAFQILQVVAKSDISVATLVQIDRLVQLIESPVFARLRLQLLDPAAFPYLYKCLYGLLMILPQSSAFKSLQTRLSSVAPIGGLPLPQTRDRIPTPAAVVTDEWDELLRLYNEMHLSK